jgi:hypothetical protein
LKDVISIKSQHKSNIFSTTFLSQSNNKKFVSSSSNGGLFYTSIEQSIENPIVNEFKCHGYKTCFEVYFKFLINEFLMLKYVYLF